MTPHNPEPQNRNTQHLMQFHTFFSFPSFFFFFFFFFFVKLANEFYVFLKNVIGSILGGAFLLIDWKKGQKNENEYLCEDLFLMGLKRNYLFIKVFFGYSWRKVSLQLCQIVRRSKSFRTNGWLRFPSSTGKRGIESRLFA